MKGQRNYIQGEILQPVEVVVYGTANSTARQVRYNLQKIEATEDKPASVEFDYVNVEELTKKAVKAAIIKTAYPDYDDELAAINNGGADYEAYQQLRTEADEVWSNIQSL